MKLLLHECTPKRLKRDFPGHEVSTVDDVGLKGLKNGDLLHAAAGRFEVLITVDSKMPFQQSLSQHQLAVLILIAKPSRYPQLRLLVPTALDALKTLQPGTVVRIETPKA